MAPRKCRSRKTADKMASYKQQMNKESGQGSSVSTPRKSLRSKKAKTRNNQSSRSPLGDGSGSLSRSCGKYPSLPVSNAEEDEIEMQLTRLEAVQSIPETPEIKVAGRKRSCAPQAIRPGGDRGQEDTDDSGIHSKKHKSFNPSARWEGNNSCDDGEYDFAEEIQKDTLLPESSEFRDRTHHGILDMALFEPSSGSAPGIREESDQIHQDLVFRRTRPGNKERISRPAFRLHDDEHDLEIISASTQALNRLFESFKMRLIDEMRGLYRQQKSDLRDLNESVMNPLLSEIRDMRGVLEIASNGIKGSSSGKFGSKTLLTEWEGKLNQITLKSEVVFNKEFFARIVCYNAPLKVYEVYNSCILSDAGKASTAVQALLFSHRPSSKKDDFSDGIGKLHSEFKYAVVQNTFYNVCKDTFDLFRSPMAPDESANSSVGDNRGRKCRINRPGWLAVGYVRVDHINDARLFMESVNYSRKSKIRGTPSSDDIATHGALRVYRFLGAHLQKGRDYMRSSFFQGLGYLFVAWRDYVSDNDQRKMKLRFDMEDGDGCLNLDNIPSTELCSFAADEEKSNKVNAANRNMLKIMYSQCAGMVLYVEHDVYVTRGGGTQRKRTGGERRTLRRLINLIEVACDVVVEYSRIGNIDLFLRGHKHALRCVMVFAFLLKQLTVEFIEMRGAIKLDPEDPEKTVPNPLDVNVENTCLKVFLPGKCVQETYLLSRCLRLSEKLYNTLHVEENEVERPSGIRSGAEVFEATEIAESDELGVASI